MLSYEFVSPSLIRSAQLRTLLGEWDVARGGAILPPPGTFRASELGERFDWMTHIGVRGAHHEPRFRIVMHGARIGEMYGAVCHGKYLDEILPPGKRAGALESYLKILEKKSPIYTVAESQDAGGNLVTEERLMLPFGNSLLGVTHIWVMIKPSSQAAKPEGSNLLSRPVVPAFVIRAAIDSSGGAAYPA